MKHKSSPLLCHLSKNMAAFLVIALAISQLQFLDRHTRGALAYEQDLCTLYAGSACNGHGSCEELGDFKYCVCDPGWVGWSCSIADPYGCPASAACLNNEGVCNMSNVCECNGGGLVSVGMTAYTAAPESWNCGDACPVGHYYNANTKMCTTCPHGHAKTEDHITQHNSASIPFCYPVNATDLMTTQGGAYIDSAGEVILPCYAGHHCANYTTFTPCDEGTFAAVGDGVCSDCPPGTYSGSGFGACLDCMDPPAPVNQALYDAQCGPTTPTTPVMPTTSVVTFPLDGNGECADGTLHRFDAMAMSYLPECVACPPSTVCVGDACEPFHCPAPSQSSGLGTSCTCPALAYVDFSSLNTMTLAVLCVDTLREAVSTAPDNVKPMLTRAITNETLRLETLTERVLSDIAASIDTVSVEDAVPLFSTLAQLAGSATFRAALSKKNDTEEAAPMALFLEKLVHRFPTFDAIVSGAFGGVQFLDNVAVAPTVNSSTAVFAWRQGNILVFQDNLATPLEGGPTLSNLSVAYSFPSAASNTSFSGDGFCSAPSEHLLHNERRRSDTGVAGDNGIRMQKKEASAPQHHPQRRRRDVNATVEEADPTAVRFCHRNAICGCDILEVDMLASSLLGSVRFELLPYQTQITEVSVIIHESATAFHFSSSAYVESVGEDIMSTTDSIEEIGASAQPLLGEKIVAAPIASVQIGENDSAFQGIIRLYFDLRAQSSSTNAPAEVVEDGDGDGFDGPPDQQPGFPEEGGEEGLPLEIEATPPVDENAAVVPTTLPQDSLVQCVFWDFTNRTTGDGRWSTDGCLTVVNSPEDGVVTCECTHLTHFTVLFLTPLPTPTANGSAALALEIFTDISLGLSIICLCAMITIFLKYNALLDKSRLLVVQLAFCLVFVYAIFLGGVPRRGIREEMCVTVGMVEHFLILASFFWMFLNGVDLHCKLVVVWERASRWEFLLSPKASAAIVYTASALLVLATFASFGPDAYHSEALCWLNPATGAQYVFLVPAGIVVIFNIVLFFVLKRSVNHLLRPNSRQPREQQQRHHHDRKSSLQSILVNLRFTLSFCCILGIGWTFGYLALTGVSAFDYLFTGFSALQGVFLFVFHCLADRRVRREWLRQKSLRKHWKRQSIILEQGKQQRSGTQHRSSPLATSKGNWESSAKANSSSSSSTALDGVSCRTLSSALASSRRTEPPLSRTTSWGQHEEIERALRANTAVSPASTVSYELAHSQFVDFTSYKSAPTSPEQEKGRWDDWQPNTAAKSGHPASARVEEPWSTHAGYRHVRRTKRRRGHYPSLKQIMPLEQRSRRNTGDMQQGPENFVKARKALHSLHSLSPRITKRTRRARVGAFHIPDAPPVLRRSEPAPELEECRRQQAQQHLSRVCDLINNEAGLVFQDDSIPSMEGKVIPPAHGLRRPKPACKLLQPLGDIASKRRVEGQEPVGFSLLFSRNPDSSPREMMHDYPAMLPCRTIGAWCTGEVHPQPAHCEEESSQPDLSQSLHETEEKMEVEGEVLGGKLVAGSTFSNLSSKEALGCRTAQTVNRGKTLAKGQSSWKDREKSRFSPLVSTPARKPVRPVSPFSASAVLQAQAEARARIQRVNSDGDPSLGRPRSQVLLHLDGATWPAESSSSRVSSPITPGHSSQSPSFLY